MTPKISTHIQVNGLQLKGFHGVFEQEMRVGNIFSFDVDVEIIKNDGSRVWGICSCVKDDYLNTGYFCIAL